MRLAWPAAAWFAAASQAGHIPEPITPVLYGSHAIQKISIEGPPEIYCSKGTILAMDTESRVVTRFHSGDLENDKKFNSP
jgi:hypothetical protein